MVVLVLEPGCFDDVLVLFGGEVVGGFWLVGGVGYWGLWGGGVSGVRRVMGCSGGG